MYHKTNFITGLRGYAALGVLLIHYQGFNILKQSNTYNKFVNLGKYGVLVFFIISAFTLTISIDRNKNFSYKQYIKKRFLRISPLYYIVLLLAFFIGGNAYYQHEFHITNSLFSLIFHYSYLNWIDYRHQNNLIGVEWSIPVEFFYYFAFPYFLQFIKFRKSLFIALLITSFLLSIKGGSIYKHLNIPTSAFNWSIIKYLFSFLSGISAYFILKKYQIITRIKYSNSVFIAMLIVFLFLVSSNLINHYTETLIIIFTLLMILIGHNEFYLKKLLFENRIILFLGKISFSIYLTHMLIMTILIKQTLLPSSSLTAFAITIVISSLTYYFIEKPFIDLGNKQSLKINLGNR